MDGNELSKSTSHKGEKRRSYSMGFKADGVKFAQEKSNNDASLKFNVDRKRVGEWRNQIGKITAKLDKRRKLEGGGRKVMNEELEENLLTWMLEHRSKMLHASRKMITVKAKSIFKSLNEDPAVRDSFLASKGWLYNFMNRNGLSYRRRTPTAQKVPSHMIDKLVLYIMHVHRLKLQFNFANDCIIAIDETPVWNDMVSSTTVDKTGVRDVPLKTPGHEKVRVSVCLAAKGD